jgi:hypothetical protein
MKIYFKYFWDNNKNISLMPFWKKLFEYVNYEPVEDENDAEVIVHSCFTSKLNFENEKKYIFFTGEPLYVDFEIYKINLSFHLNSKYKNVILCPQMLLSIYNVDIPRSFFLKKRPVRNDIPSKFCCFVTRIEKPERIDFFNKLSKYKQVDSLGPCLNNTGILAPYEHDKFIEMISEYKFIITFENTQIDNYITEKIFHGYYSQIIPIYWGSKYINEYFNIDSMIYIEEYNETNISNAIKQIIELDNNDELYMNKVNNSVFKKDFDIDCFFEDIKSNIKNVLD